MKNNGLISSLSKLIHMWINWADDQDKQLNSKFRKGKWFLILLLLLLLFSASFIWFPMLGFYRGDLASPRPSQQDSVTDESIRASFEIPIDSFELQLQKSIHENTIKKE